MRQFGATHIDIDTERGWASFAIAEPRPLDLASIGEVMDSASYELHGVELTVSGTVERDASGTAVLILDGTGQRLRLRGTAPADGRVRLAGALHGWDGGEVALEVGAQ